MREAVKAGDSRMFHYNDSAGRCMWSTYRADLYSGSMRTRRSASLAARVRRLTDGVHVLSSSPHQAHAGVRARS